MARAGGGARAAWEAHAAADPAIGMENDDDDEPFDVSDDVGTGVRRSSAADSSAVADAGRSAAAADLCPPLSESAAPPALARPVVPKPSAAARAWLERGGSIHILAKLPHSPGAPPATSASASASAPGTTAPAIAAATKEVSRFAAAAAAAQPVVAPSKRTPPWRAGGRRVGAGAGAGSHAADGEGPRVGSALSELLQAAELGANSPMPSILRGLSERLKAQQQQHGAAP